MDLTDDLLAKYRIISNQIDEAGLKVVLAECARALNRCKGGTVVEFGCYVGTTSLFLRRLLDELSSASPFHVYDSFAGLPPKSSEDISRAGEQYVAGELAASKKQLLLEFKKANLARPIIHKGWFEDLAPIDVPSNIAFAFLDGDFYNSIKASLKLVLPKMLSGGTIVIDDYAREALPGVNRAVIEFGLKASTIHNLGVIRL